MNCHIQIEEGKYVPGGRGSAECQLLERTCEGGSAERTLLPSEENAKWRREAPLLKMKYKEAARSAVFKIFNEKWRREAPRRF